MYLWLNQKKIKIGTKVYYIFYLLNKNKVLCRLGYILHYKNITLVRINLNKFFLFLFYFKGLLSIRESIYLKFFILSYFFLDSFGLWYNSKKFWNRLPINK